MSWTSSIIDSPGKTKKVVNNLLIMEYLYILNNVFTDNGACKTIREPWALGGYTMRLARSGT